MTTVDGTKRKNPLETANFVSSLFFGWTLPLFYTGWKRQIGIDDLYPAREKDKSKRLGDQLEKIWQQQVEAAKKRGGEPSLRKALLIMVWKKFAIVGIAMAINEVGLKVLNPYLVGRLLTYFSPNSTLTQSDALVTACGIVACIALGSLLNSHAVFHVTIAGMQVRLACCSLVFRKAMRLSRTSLGDTTTGQVVNLLSNDVARFDNVCLFLNYMWLSPLSGIIASVLLYQVLGPAGLIGVAAIFLIIPLQSYTARLTSKFRTRTALRTDERVRLMDEIICGIQVLKMYAWEKPFSQLISLARKKEIKEITGMCLLRGVFMSSLMFTTRFALFCTFISYVLMGNALKASQVYISMGFYNVLTFTLGTMFVRGLSECAEAHVSICRLQKFLMYEEYQDTPGRIESKPGDRFEGGVINKGYANGALVDDEDNQKTIPKATVAVASAAVAGRSGSLVFEDATACWLPTNNEDTLRNVSVTVKPGELVAVIGPVGSGKSSVLQAALGELPLKSGKVHLYGRVSYCAQGPWVRGASIRGNIIFGAQFNRRRYDRVVRACALQTDLANFPDGDLTVVGDRGASLSGGQKARINLARAVYREADIYLLDDPLSAVDVHVGRHLFEECIQGFLAGKTRILVTHQVQHLTDASRIIIMNNGKIEMIGTFSQLVASDVDYAQLLQIEGDDDVDADGGITPSTISGGSDLENQKSLARALRQLSRASFKNSVSSCRSSRRSSRGSAMDSQLDAEDFETDVTAETVAQFEASSKGAVKGSLLIKYFKSGTNVCGLLCVGLLFIFAQAIASGTDAFVGFWTNVEEARSAPPVTPVEGIDWPALFSSNTCIYIYTGIIVSLLCVTLIRSFALFLMCMQCSQSLHDAMFFSMVSATMRFFHNNPSGRILNRFSKDLGAIDELLPKALCDASQVLLSLLGATVVCAATFPLFLIPVVIMLIMFVLIRQMYLRTSKEVKRMEGMTRSPVFSHLNSTLQGLATIRAFNAQLDQEHEFDEHQDMHTSAWFMFISSNASFALMLDLVGLAFISIVCFTLTLASYGMAPGTVGLAITQSFVLTGMVQFGIRQSAEAQNQLMAVERVLEYTALPPEPDNPPLGDGTITHREPKVSTEEVLPPPDWPQQGKIGLKDVYLWYSPQDPPVLRGLNINILPQEKVGIVGRTGAGKSSMIVALFRMAPIRGKIMLDGVDITTMPVQYLRSKISIIPQDPVLFSGTLRYNLDPFGQYPDYALWAALEDVELKEMAEDMQGLDGHVQEGGGNLSVGQRQLLCLARAILRGNRILLLDEATANVDPQTDFLIQRTIRSKFAHCTVLTVAHRLHTIMDSDKVLVMDQGKVAEFEHPHVLIQRHGILYGMVQETGHQTAEGLIRVSREAFDKKKAV